MKSRASIYCGTESVQSARNRNFGWLNGLYDCNCRSLEFVVIIFAAVIWNLPSSVIAPLLQYVLFCGSQITPPCKTYTNGVEQLKHVLAILSTAALGIWRLKTKSNCPIRMLSKTQYNSWWSRPVLGTKHNLNVLISLRSEMFDKNIPAYVLVKNVNFLLYEGLLNN